MLIQELTLRGILSFASNSPPLAMRPLNLLIGPNGSGKSNLIEAVGLLRSSPAKLSAPLRGTGGGVQEWIWKGESSEVATVEATIGPLAEMTGLRHRIEFTGKLQFELAAESIESSTSLVGQDEPQSFYQFHDGRFEISLVDGTKRTLRKRDILTNESILSQRKDPQYYPELAELASFYERVRLYRSWTFGRTSILRSPQAADLPGDELEEDFSNLGLFLNHLRGKPKAKKAIIERLQDLYEGLDDFDVRIKGGTVELFLTEGDFTIPGTRLSDGTLRYLCLLAILCDPDPPPLICIEEPELGLHPDMLPKLADLLIAASDRTQLIVTTHSDMLVDAMTEQPESVVVMEKHEGKTQAKRLQNDAELQAYLKDYRLGELWIRGMIGGTRW